MSLSTLDVPGGDWEHDGVIEEGFLAVELDFLSCLVEYPRTGLQALSTCWAVFAAWLVRFLCVSL